MEIRCIKVHELEMFVQQASSANAPGAVVPMSVTWSRAHVRNPCADDADVGLIVAYEGGTCIGYLTLVPGLFRADGETEKISRLSACYVPPEHRHTGLGGLLMLRALGLRRSLVSTGFSDEVERVYEALRFKPLGPLRYLVADLKWINALGLMGRGFRKSLRRRGSTTPRLDRLIDTWDRVGSTLIHRCLLASMAELRADISVKPVEQVQEAFESEQDARMPVRFLRNAAEINWMLAHRWVASDPSQATPGYHFKDHDTLFGYFAVEVHGRHDGSYKGFAVMRTDSTYGRRNITLFDYHMRDESDEVYLLPMVLEHAARVGADVVRLPAACEPMLHRWRAARLLFRVAHRPYFCRPGGPKSLLERYRTAIALSLCDGDVAFA